MEPAATPSRIRELSVGVGSAAGILALIIAPWWMIDVLLIGGGAITLWWSRQVPLERVVSPRLGLPLAPVLLLTLAGMVTYSAYRFVDRLSLLFMAAFFAAAAVLLLVRWHSLVRHV